MPLAAPPGPLWTADAKEPHPFNIGSIEWVYIGLELGDLTWKLESVGAEPDAN